jgi:hypothetical protein
MKMNIKEGGKMLGKRKKNGSKNGSKVEPIKIRTTSSSVIELNTRLKKGENDIFGSTEPQNIDEIYNRFLSFIQSYRAGKRLPQGRAIEQALNISSKKRKELAKRAFDEGILRKPTPNSYEFVV